MKRKHERYFLYRENPFRPLYMYGIGFREPPSPLERSLARRGTFEVWTFTTRSIARAMCLANNRPPDKQCSYAELSQFNTVGKVRSTSAPKPESVRSTGRGPRLPSTLEELA